MLFRSRQTKPGDDGDSKRSRRGLFIGAGAALVAAVGVGIGVAASGGKKSSSTSTTEPSGSTDSTPATSAVPTTAGGEPGVTAAGGEPGSTVNVLNWPMYVENDDASSSVMLKSFTEATSIKVEYEPGIDSNDTFWTKYQPALAKGDGNDKVPASQAKGH